MAVACWKEAVFVVEQDVELGGAQELLIWILSL
jgi:hypothetical protein